MDTITVIGIALIAYGLFAAYIALVRPPKIWQIGKIQGFVQILGEAGTVVFFMIIAVATFVGGIFLLA